MLTFEGIHIENLLKILNDMPKGYSWSIYPAASSIGHPYNVIIYRKKHWWSKRHEIERTESWGHAAPMQFVSWLRVYVDEVKSDQ